MSTSLLQEIEEYLARTGTAATTFGQRAVSNGHFVHSLRAGARPRPTRAEKARLYMQANPAGCPRSAKVTRLGSDPREYILARIKREDRGYDTPCWVWARCLNEKGYAQAKVPGFGRVRIHRASYHLHAGPIPDGFEIDHLCRVKSCCNPDHLEAVSPDENRRRAQPFRQQKHQEVRVEAVA